MEEGLGQVAHQSLGLLLILLRCRLLGGGKEHPPPVGVVDQQRRVHPADMAAVGAGGGVEAPLPNALGQVGPLDDVDDEPDFEVDGLPTLGTGGLEGLGVRA